jgi:hypothetical protein
MDQKQQKRRPQKLDTYGIRGLVFALAVSSTIGFWAIFSRVDGLQSSGKDSPDQPTDDLSAVQDENITVLDLPPIPTLIPTMDQSISNLPVTAMNLPISVQDGSQVTDLAANPTQIAQPPSTVKPARETSSKPVKPKKVRSKSTTKTRSS